ncbi:hypothetical protein [Paenibacillus senegalensis]|uniref:hypothetical protein n=1 Tax=Paenibacillus senegalensis TaxID=1465766 RepID=UPI000288B79D|nr:hypothetical protein [Paenibacillus senegalensis]
MSEWKAISEAVQRENQQLREENQKLREDKSRLLTTLKEYKDNSDQIIKEAVEERDKLIEALREIEDESSQEDACITKINGIAHSTLKEIGVTP